MTRGRKIFSPRKFRLAVPALLTIALLLTCAFAEKFCPYEPDEQNFSISLQPPSADHPAGTDQWGRDMLSRIFTGLRTSVFSTLALVAIACGLGTFAGVASAWCGGAVDSVLMRISDACLALPGLVFALAIAGILGGGIGNAVLALAAVTWPKYARLARSRARSLKNSPFILAARQSGCTDLSVMTRHVLPNIAGPVAVTASLDVGTMMTELAALSFLGLGAQPPTAELGSMMSAGRSMIQTYPWVVLGPGIAIFFAVAIFNLLGDALRDSLDPRSR